MGLRLTSMKTLGEIFKKWTQQAPFKGIGRTLGTAQPVIGSDSSEVRPPKLGKANDCLPDLQNTESSESASIEPSTKEPTPTTQFENVDTNASGAATRDERATQSLPRPIFPDDMYELTAADLRAQRDKHRADVAKLTSLRTRAMREKDAQPTRSRPQARFAILRIRFPDGFVLQGTFDALETLAAVCAWVSEHIDENARFRLVQSGRGGNNLATDSTLRKLGFPPYALLHIQKVEGDVTLKQELKKTAKKLE